MKKIALNGLLGAGLFALVDDDDLELASKYRWTLCKLKGIRYASTKMYVGGKRTTVMLHKYVMQGCCNLSISDRDKCNEAIFDHIDHDGLNCQKSNLRQCTPQQNLFNSRKKNASTATSKYKGVYYNKINGIYRASITKNGERYELGSYRNEIDAAKAYDNKAKELFGEFSCTNF